MQAQQEHHHLMQWRAHQPPGTVLSMRLPPLGLQKALPWGAVRGSTHEHRGNGPLQMQKDQMQRMQLLMCPLHGLPLLLLPLYPAGECTCPRGPAVLAAARGLLARLPRQR